MRKFCTVPRCSLVSVGLIRLIRRRKFADNLPMRALSIRQPWAELILRGIKTIEYRSRATSIVGERFWIYASKGTPKKYGVGSTRQVAGKGIWSTDLAVPGENVIDTPLPWMVELANALRLFPHELPKGVIVGSAVISKVVEPSDEKRHPYYEWHLTDVKRAATLREPDRHPQPVWFLPF
jgi:hypothetical protein